MRTSTRRRGLLAAGIGLALGLALVSATAASASALFSDDFESGDTSVWTRTGGSWSTVSDGTRVFRQSSTSSTTRALAGSAAWTDYSFQADVKPLAFNGSNRYVGIVARAQSTSSFYYLVLRNTGTAELGTFVGGTATPLAAASIGVSTGTWYHLRLDTFGTTVAGFVDGTAVGSVADASFSSGRVGFAAQNVSAEFDNAIVDSTAGPAPTPTTSSPPVTPGPPAPSGSPVGFAAVPALGTATTTGGAGGPSVTVSTAAAFIDVATRPGPYVIWINGVIPLAAMQSVASDKTIVGVGAASGFTGFGLTVGLPVDDAVTAPPANAVHNIIIRNLTFAHSGDDAINVQMYSHHIWIDHNDLCCGFDGLVDIKRGSSYITVSWNHAHNHTKDMLLGHDDGNAAQDVGFLKVTYHHNFFDQTPQRNPRVRFGEPVHVFNNYYLHNTDVGVACQANAGCLVEGNYFDNVEVPVTNHYAGPTGRCVARQNVFVGPDAGTPDCSGAVQEARSYYPYTLDNPNDVKSIVLAGAGAGHIGQ